MENKGSAHPFDTAAEGIVNGHFGAVGSAPALKDLKGATRSLFGLGIAGSILFDIDEYAAANLKQRCLRASCEAPLCSALNV
ncbi:hypothetical protein [Nitratireductor sp. GCM10026969]|uniref:hypothetical protein n=1 Tax=Nitratireductor sp. GCM10026969 TaxID=3252645 RepID=UPI0036133016